MNKTMKLPDNPFESIDFSSHSVNSSQKIFDSSFEISLYREKRFNKFIHDTIKIGYRANEIEGTFKRPFIIVKRSDFEEVKSKITVPILWRTLSEGRYLIYPK